MEFGGENLITLTEYLNHSMSSDVNIRRPAEKFLESIERNQNYPALLLHLIEQHDLGSSVRIAGAIAFKNYIKRNWKVEEDGVDLIHEQDRNTIKKAVVYLMFHSPGLVQNQLSDVISIIGKHDFPNKWPDLIDQMVAKFATGDFHIINGVLHTADSLFKRYRYEFPNDTLWTEIKFVLEKFAKPLTDLFVATMALTQVHANNTDALKVIYNSLTILSDVFYSLNYQDLPEFFEDNMEIWMSNFLQLLTTNVPVLDNRMPEVPGTIEELKSQVCENIALYAQKYNEEFQKYVPQFLDAIWKLLNVTSQEPKYDEMVSNALQFMVTIADRDQYKGLFEESETLRNICTNLITPNIEFREADKELFEWDPDEYIRRDIEGSDVDTRRRAACDLVKVLAKHFGAKVMDIFGTFVLQRLEEYAANPSANWRKKDTVIYLVTSSASRGQTQKHGVTMSNEFVPIPQFYIQHIQPELDKIDVDEFPVLRAASIKFVMTFRSILPREMVVGALSNIVRHLSSTSMIIQSYSAYTIERILALRGPDNLPLVKCEELTPLSAALLKGLFAILDASEDDNEYVMKAIMRSFGTLRDNIVPFLDDLLPKLTQQLAKNPTRPNFTHYLFETFSLSIRIVCKINPSAVGSFEQVLFPIFEQILQKDIQEYIPYVFQVLALLLELHTDQNVPEPYMALFPCLLVPVLFEHQENIHSLNRLLQAYVTQGSHQIIAQEKTTALLGVFQKLIASKLNDHEGFLLMQSIIESFPPNVLDPYIKLIFELFFRRLSSSKTAKFTKSLIVFFAHYIVRYGATNLVKIIDQIQPQMFGMVLDRVLIPELPKVSGDLNRKVVAVGISSLLIDCPIMLEGEYNVFYPKLLGTLVEFFESSECISPVPEDDLLPSEPTFAPFSSMSSQLICAKNPRKDPVAAVGDVRIHLAQGLGRLPREQLSLLLRQVSETNTNHLKNYLQSVGIGIA